MPRPKRTSLRPTKGTADQETGEGKEKGVVRRRGKLGKLERIHSIPTEIFLEICSHLSPLDVLHMTRTTRAWREVLMTRASTPIWRAARSTIPDLPDCPDDISEAQYARLLFEKDCHTCSVVNGPDADFALRLRLCKSCKKQLVFPAGRFTVHFPGEDSSVLQLVPHTHIGAHSHGRGSSTFYYYKPAVSRMIQKSIRYKATLNEQKYEDWRIEQITKAAAVRESVRALNVWSLERKQEAAMQKHWGRVDRLADIEARLLELGYDERDTDISYHWLPALRTHKPLTDKGWELIRKDVEVIVKQKRQRRLLTEQDDLNRIRQEELKPFYDLLYPDGAKGCSTAIGEPICLTCGDFYELPTVRAIWKNRNTPISAADFPDPETVKREMQELVPKSKCRLQLLLHEFYPKDIASGETDHASSDEQLHSDLPPDSPLLRSWKKGSVPSDLPSGLPDLRRATSLFLCPSCWEPLHFPEMLDHPHIRDRPTYSSWCVWRNEPSDIRFVTVGSWCIRVMQRMLQDLGLPDDTPPRSLPSNISCGACDFSASSWQDAFKHTYRSILDGRINSVADENNPHHPRGQTGPLFRLDPPLAAHGQVM